MSLRALLLPVFLTALPLFSQNTLATVDGKVVNAVTGQPVKKAVVTVRNGSGRQSYFAASDAEGKFHIDNVQPEKYLATATAEGFANVQSTSGVKLFTVSGQQPVSGIEIRLAPLSVIAGKVTDDADQPLDGVSVMALRYFYQGDSKTLNVGGSAQTDDRGQFRIFDIQPGRYYLVASAQYRGPSSYGDPERTHSTVPEQGYGALIYPGVADVSEASAHELKPGDEWLGANFRMRMRPAFHIRGRVAAAPGRANLQVQQCSPTLLPGRNLQAMMNRQTGVFDVVGALSGTYCMTVVEPGRGGVAARRTLTVKDGDVNDIVLTPETPLSVTGTIAIDGTPPAKMPGMNVAMRSDEDFQQARGQVKSDNTFQIDNVYPGRHIISFSVGQQLYIKSMTYGSDDVSSGVIPNVQPGVALNIVLGTDPGEIDGTVQLGSLASGAPVRLVALPDAAHAARTDLVRYGSAAAEGSFTLPSLAPGDYKIYAIEQRDNEDMTNRDLLKALEGNAVQVTVHAAGHEQISVTPVSAAEIVKALEKAQ